MGEGTRTSQGARRAALIVAGLIVALAVSWLARGEAPLSRDGLSMDTPVRITAIGRDEARLSAALDDAYALLARLDDELSMYREGSTVWEINARAGGEAVPVSPDVEAVIAEAERISRLTDGAFAPLIGPLTRLWKIGRSEQDGRVYRPPTRASLDEALPLTSIDVLERRPGHVRLARPGARLDLGGIAKGHASSKIAEMFAARGITSALIDIGGNVQVVGTRGGEPWRIGVRDPSDPRGAPALVLAVSDMAVITSGVYERYRIVDGVRRSHLIDPRTGMPIEEDLSSATVVSPDGTLADALATALMIMGHDGAVRFLRDHPELGVGAVLIRQRERGIEISATEGLRSAIVRAVVEPTFFRDERSIVDGLP